MKDYITKTEAYRLLALCYKHLYQYKFSLNCLKKMLQLAWDTQNKKAEILCYEELGMIHYYDGNLEKAKYYTERATRGWFEKDES